MSPETRNPASVGALNRVDFLDASSSFDVVEYNDWRAPCPLAPFEKVARKYRLQPLRARLICELAGIGRAR